MRAVIQRVAEANCRVDGNITGSIDTGLVILLGVGIDDTKEDLLWLAQKITSMRIFSDDVGLMNKSISEVGGRILVISQFTLFAQTKKGNRPSFIRAAKPDVAIPMYEQMIKTLGELTSTKIETGIFGADMKISLVNDGPVTIILDTMDRDNH